MLGAARDIKLRMPDQAGQRAADKCAGMACRRNIGIVQHGVPVAAQAAIMARLRFAERGQQAMARQSGGIAGGLTEADWLGMSMQRAIDDENLRLQSGIAFLASVGSTAPFVGLFGTVWGVLHALINIGVAGQFSIDKVAGPVGESLIMTAIGLAVAVPAVLSYNLLVRRNKVIHEKLRAFAGDLQTYLLTSKR